MVDPLDEMRASAASGKAAHEEMLEKLCTEMRRSRDRCLALAVAKGHPIDKMITTGNQAIFDAGQALGAPGAYIAATMFTHWALEFMKQYTMQEHLAGGEPLKEVLKKVHDHAHDLIYNTASLLSPHIEQYKADILNRMVEEHLTKKEKK